MSHLQQARQYCGQLGKQANCQALVSLTPAGQEVPLPVGLRLFLPEEWIQAPRRCTAAGVPKAEIIARSLPGDEVWLVGEWRTSGERKYDLSNLPPKRHDACWWPRSRRAGSASRDISN